MRGPSTLVRQALTAPPILPGTWLPVGPTPIQNGQENNVSPNDEVSGAIETVAAQPGKADVIYIGAVNGGIWKTTNGTASNPTWTPLTDSQASASIEVIKFDPTDATHNTLIAGTGDTSSFGDAGGPLTGLLRTTDGGAHWTAINDGGALAQQGITGVAAVGSTIISSAGIGGAPSCATSGIFRSADGGTTFTQVSGASGTGLSGGMTFDLAEDPKRIARPSHAAVAVDYYAVCSGEVPGIYKSTDTGATWTKVSNSTMDALFASGPPGTSNIRIAVGDSDNVFVGIVKNNGSSTGLDGLFLSSDGGVTWQALDTTFHLGAGYPWFSMAADIDNPNLVYIGGRNVDPATRELTLFRVDASQAPGSQASNLTGSNTASSSAPHVDQRAMAIDANGNLLATCDGGIFRRTSPTNNAGDWFSVNGNLQVTEFYSQAYDNISKVLFGGSQDNGTSMQVTTGNQLWTLLLAGDGDDVAVDVTSVPGESIRYYAADFLSSFTAATYNANNVLQSSYSKALTPVGGSTAPIWPFATPFKVNAIDPTRLVFGGLNAVYESSDQGNTIVELSPAITANSPTSPPDYSGNTSIVYGGHSGTDNADLLYVGSDNSVYLRTAPPPAAMTQLS